MLSEDGVFYLWKQVYDMTEDVTPLGDTDCGQLCDSICCKNWAPGVGVYLYPGEQLLIADQPWLSRQWHDSRDYEFPPSWEEGGWFITCDENCERSLRPFNCRTFPLTAHLDDNNKLDLILNDKGQAICPLIQGGSKRLLTAKFRFTMYQAWRLLLNFQPVSDDIKTASDKRRRENLL